jgi:hypothetical protein
VSHGRLDIVHQRLGQHLGHRSFRGFHTPGDVVQSFGAVQAQDYLGSLWGIGLRLPGSRERDIERAVADRTIVRTWPMRGTLHFVAAADVRWMLALLTPAILKRGLTRHAELGLDEAVFRKSRKALVKALQGGRQRTRTNVYEVLEGAKVSTAGQRGIHILWRLAQEGLICFGAREGKQPTVVLLDDWIPEARPLAEDEALALVARRYFAGHGPATLADFTWWSGLPAAKARAALDSVKGELAQETLGGATYWFADAAMGEPGTAPAPRRTPRSTGVKRPRVPRAHLLPAFDEFLVAYKDRSTVVATPRAEGSAWNLLSPTYLIEGRVAGTWRRELRGKDVVVTITPFTRLKAADAKALERVVEEYAAFLGKAPAMRVGQR